MEYRASLTRENGTVLVSFADMPGAISFGKDEADALSHGRDALITIVEALIKDRRPVPTPNATEGALVSIPALLAAKIALHNEMLAQSVSKAELGRRLDQHGPQIDRLVDVHHGSKLDQLEAAFEALGKRIILTIGEKKHSPQRLVRQGKQKPVAKRSVKKVANGGMKTYRHAKSRKVAHRASAR